MIINRVITALAIFEKIFILDVWQGSEYAFEYRVNLFLPNVPF